MLGFWFPFVTLLESLTSAQARKTNNVTEKVPHVGRLKSLCNRDEVVVAVVVEWCCCHWTPAITFHKFNACQRFAYEIFFSFRFKVAKVIFLGAWNSFSCLCRTDFTNSCIYKNTVNSFFCIDSRICDKFYTRDVSLGLQTTGKCEQEKCTVTVT